MFTSFRSRLVITVIVLIAATAGFVAAMSFVFVRDSLRGQLLEDALARAEFNIGVLASEERLAAGAGRTEFEESGLADRFLLRGTGGVYTEFPDSGESTASSLSLLGGADLVSPELRQIVERGELGYEFLTFGDEPTLIVGGRRPPAGPDFYFFFSAADVEQAVSQLGRVLVVAGIGILLLGAVSAGLIARRVLRPVGVAGRAAEQMAEGDLSVRLPAGSKDEFGRWAEAFNKMASSLEQQIEALLEAQDRERRFVADVSHELRTPLTALVSEASMLEAGLDDLSDSERRVGEMMVADVGRLRTLVEDLLEVSRLSSSGADTHISDVDLEGFLAAVVADRDPEAQLRVADSGLQVRTDRRSLERIVGNLLDNARSHASGVPAHVAARVEGGILYVEVADEGPGVPAAELSRLFDRFYKTDTSRQGGSGLGLAIARQHARHLGGDLTVRPGPERGLVFELVLPVTDSLPAGDPGEKLALQPEGE